MSELAKVLVIAEAANPEWVSVPLVGWSMAVALRKVADVHIVTQVRNRDAFVRAGFVEGADFTAIDSEAAARPAFKLAALLGGSGGKGWTIVQALATLSYPYFEHLVWKKFGAAIRAGQYDIVHRVTPLSPTAPSPIARKVRKAGAAFIMGPLNGGLPWPAQFDGARRKEREWLSYVRGAYKAMPGLRSAWDAATCIIAGSRHTAADLPPRLRTKIAYMPENGLSLVPPEQAIDRQSSDRPPLRLCFIGRLVAYKGADMALEAAAPLLRTGQAMFDIIGDGPVRAELEASVAKFGLGGSVTFRGWVSYSEVQALAQQSDIFLFPSIREFGGGAVLEAMANGLVPVIVDYGGPAELVEAGGGIAVPLGARSEIIAALHEALLSLEQDRSAIRRIGSQARRWAASEMTWDAKARRMRRLYAWARAPDGPPPTLFGHLQQDETATV